MGRVVKGTALEIKPQRYLNAPFSLDEFNRWGTYQEARKSCPYKPGDVVWSEAGRRALVLRVHIRRVRECDPSSDLLPVLQVREMTASGTWSKLWRRCWPGDIDRAYEAYLAAQEKSA